MKQNIFPIITRYMKWFAVVSALVLIPGIISLLKFGVRPSIDFTGGTLLELQISNGKQNEYTETAIKGLLSKDEELVSIQWSGTTRVLLRLSPLDVIHKSDLENKLKKVDPGVSETRYETLGPILGHELIVKTGYAVALSVVLIAIYLGIRFSSFQYGVSAAVATLHDGLVVLGTFSILGHFAGVEVDVLFVTALLTILSFSVHDTIIVYDRIRERLARKTNASFEEIVNMAALETLNRSLRNSLAVLFMLAMVFLLTAGTLHWFVLTLLVGTLTGTYSSTCVALPLLVIWERVQRKQRK